MIFIAIIESSVRLSLANLKVDFISLIMAVPSFMVSTSSGNSSA